MYMYIFFLSRNRKEITDVEEEEEEADFKAKRSMRPLWSADRSGPTTRRHLTKLVS